MTAIQQIPMFVVNPDIEREQQLQQADSRGEPAICPSCRLRPVRWNSSKLEWSRFCHTSYCSNHQRKCTYCGRTYDRADPDGGTKYCSHECKTAGYQSADNSNRRRQEPVPCANCQHPITGAKPNADVCRNCRGRYSSQIASHHLDTDWALRLINATHCDCCGEKLTRNHDRHKGIVDHDHGCCPGQVSCGKCVRGIICNDCNTKAGAIEANPERYQAVLNYLGRGL
jgi:hypothetical protein